MLDVFELDLGSAITNSHHRLSAVGDVEGSSTGTPKQDKTSTVAAIFFSVRCFAELFQCKLSSGAYQIFDTTFGD